MASSDALKAYASTTPIKEQEIAANVEKSNSMSKAAKYLNQSLKHQKSPPPVPGINEA